MSFTDNYLAIVNNETTAKKKKKKKQSTGHSFTDAYNELVTEPAQEKEIAPVFVNKTAPLYQPTDIAPVVTKTILTGTRKDKEEDDDGSFLDLIGKSAMSGLASFNKGLTSTADVILGKPLQALGWENNPISSMADYYSEGYEHFKGKTDTAAQKLGNGVGVNAVRGLTEGTVAAVPDAILALMTAGGSKVATTSTLATKAAYEGGNLLTKAGVTVETMMRKPQFWTSFARTYGTDYEEAKKKGASDSVAAVGAMVSSLVNAGVEIGTDGMSGFQGLPEKVAKGNKNAILEWVQSSLEEGGEEVVQGVVSNLVSKVAYDRNTDVLNAEQMVKEFGMGAAVGGILGGGQIATMATANAVTDAVQQHEAKKLTENEQKVVDKETANRIAEREQDGETLTNKQKKDIRDAVLHDMERGYISTDTIEEVLGGETYKGYKNTIDFEDGLQSEFDQLNRMKQGDMTGEQVDRRNELKAQLEELKTKSQRGQMQSKLRDEVMGLVKGDRLAESYNEQYRRGENFTADISKYDAKQQATIQKAIDSGILNNTNRTHELVDMVAKIAADKGVSFDFTNNEKLKKSGFAVDGNRTVNGFLTKDGVTINIDSKKSLNRVVGHEITHVLEGTELYDTLKTAVAEYAKTKQDYHRRYAELSKLYEGVEGSDVEAELTADLVGDYLFSDENFVKHLSVNHRNIFQKFYDEVKYLCKVVTAGSKEARQLEKVKHAFDKVYKESGKQTEGTTYSLSDANDAFESYTDSAEKSVFRTGWMNANKRMVDAVVRERGKTQTPQFKSWFGESKAKTKNGEPLLVFHGTESSFASFETDGKPIWFSPSVMYAQQYSGSVKFADKMRSTSKVYGGATDKVIPAYISAQNPADFGNTDGAFSDNIHDISERIGVSESELLKIAGKIGSNATTWKVLHSAEMVELLKRHGYDSVTAVENGGVTWGVFDSAQVKSAVANNGSFNVNNPDIRYSLSDSDGVELSAEQQEYFKDSVVRDENGNLKRMYHGTPNGDYTVFRDGTYFTDNKEYADRYQSPSASSISSGKTASNPKTFEVYLDIKKPFDISDAEARDIYINEYIKGGNALGINPYLSDAEYDKIRTIDWTEGEDLRDFLIDNDYDYDGLVLDEGADGGYGDEVQYRGKSYVVFSPEQVKNVDNAKPTADKDIRFSLSESVEETRDLVALHNLRTDELLETIKLSGLPSPSVAIIKAKDGHEKYGDVSLILPKNAIDPQTNKANRIYGSDAWTPTRSNAPVEYEVNYDTQRQFERTVEQLANKVANGVFSKSSVLGMAGIEGTTDKNLKSIAEKISDYDAVRAAYVAENGGDVEVVYREKKFDSYGNDALKSYIDNVGEQEVARLAAKMLVGDRLTAAEIEPAKDAITDSWIATRENALKQKPELREKRISVFRERLTDLRTEDFVRHAWQFYEDSGATTDEIDRMATSNNLRDAADRADVEAWVANKLQGLLGEPGIYNGKDLYTPSGKPRSFKETHWEYTAENIVRAMNNADARGANVMNVSGEAIIATATPEYKNIDEVRADKDRLFKADDDYYDQIKEEISEELQTITRDIVRTTEHHSDNQYEEEQIIGSVIMDAAQGTKTIAGVRQVFRKNGYRISDAQAQSVLALFDKASNVPTGYFEAKPQRVVGFDEVGVYVIPNNADTKLKQELLNRGYSIAEYDPNVEGDRQRVVNGFEEYKFSLSEVGETFQRRSSFDIMGEDVRLQPREQIAPVQETAEESPAVDKPVSTTEMAEMFPDDVAPMQQRLDEVENDIKQIEDAVGLLSQKMMDGEITTDDYFARMEEIDQRHKALLQEREALTADDTERVNSLAYAEAPEEAEAPYYGEEEPAVVDDPFRDRDAKEVSKRNVNAYMYENPDVRPFFQMEADRMLGELANSTKGERWYNDEVYYRSNGEAGWGGTKRNTSESIEELLDVWGMSYADIEKGLNAIVEDHGAENIAAAKKIEFVLHDRLMKGYNDFYSNGRIEPNQDYLDLLYEKQITAYNEEARQSLWDADAPAEIAPVMQQPQARPTPKPAQQNAPTAPEPKVAKVLTEEPEVQKRKRNMLNKFMTNFADKGWVFENLAKKTKNRELEGKYNFMHYSESRAQEYIKDNLMPLVERAEASGKTKQLYDYVYNLHNIDRMSLDTPENAAKRAAAMQHLEGLSDEQINKLSMKWIDKNTSDETKTRILAARDYVDANKTKNKPVFGDEVTADVSRKAVQQLEADNPEFKAFGEAIVEYNTRLRDMLVDGNIISQETADLWAKQYPHYVPIRRAGHEGQSISVPLDTKKTGVNAPIQRATGGSSDILPLFDTMAMRTEQTFKAIARNSFGTELMHTLDSVVDQQDVGMEEAMESMSTDTELLQEGKNGQAPTFTVFEDGKRVTFEITEDMYDALKPTSDGLAYTNKVANTANTVFRGLLTEYNPVFLFTNAVKDAQDVLINSQHAGKTYSRIPQAIAQIAGKGHWYTEYTKNGGEQNTYFESDSKTFKETDKGIKKILGLPLRPIVAANNFIERIPRLAEYIASREAGRSIEVSMLDAARVTTNFAAGGDVTKFINRNGATFLNASVQGTMQQVRNIREAKMNGLKGWLGLATKFALAGAPALILNNLIWDDDDEYEELSDYVKQNYYVVAKFGDGKFVRIPKGRTVAVIQDALVQMQNMITGDDEADFKSFAELAIGNLAPNNPIDNNLLAPIMQVMNNKTWYGEDLIPTRLQDLPAAEQYDESTDALSRWLGEKASEIGFDVSPYKINYLLNQYSGGVGDVVLPMLTPEAERGDNSMLGNAIAPFKDKFTTDGVMNNQNVSDFYDTKQEMTTNAKSSKATDEDILKNKYLSAVNDEISELYKQKRKVQNSDKSDAEKYELVRDIQSQIVEMTRDALENYENIERDGNYAKIGDVYFEWYTPEIGESYWRKLTDKQKTKYLVTSAAGAGAHYATDGNVHYRKDEDGEWTKISDKQLAHQKEVTSKLGITPEEYWSETEISFMPMTDGEYEYAFENPETYAVSKAVGGYDAFTGYKDAINDLKADKDKNGKTISGSKKKKVTEYINSLDDLDYGQRIILYRSMYDSKADKAAYDADIVEYLSSRDDLSYDELIAIYKKLGFTISEDGTTVSW